MVFWFHLVSAVLFLAIAGVSAYWPPVAWGYVLLVPVWALGVYDTLQKRKAVLRNFPVIGHFRYLFELIRPEINQYFIESDTDGAPINRERRSIVYQRAKRVLDTLPFGTQHDVYEPGYEWLNHSIAAKHPLESPPRITIGGPDCTQPYAASLLNISAMSFGSLSSAAVRALNAGAREGGFFHNTGEGGLSTHHQSGGGDICWQIGTGYFGCRDEHGRFDARKFEERATLPQVKLIEIKLSQGAKPGHGGVLPKAKITDEIAAIRGVGKDKDVISPPAHSAFDSPRGLMEFVKLLRELSGGKPVGFKLCLGHPAEFVALCKAMIETGITPDFITVDGGEGGTGAAPLEFSNSVGTPLTEGLVGVHNALVGYDLRSRIKIIASSKVITGFDMAKRLASGADLLNSARGFMLSLGCIQARRCNTNHCPVGVATQDPKLVRGLVVTDKAKRVANWHKETIEAFLELLGAAGIPHPDDLRPHHIHRRLDQSRVETLDRIYTFIEPGALLRTPQPAPWADWIATTSADSFTISPVGTWKGHSAPARV
ncbi:MAG: FMN-binding glutamate synthase family protein [Planctomycetota bacterium]